MALTEEMIRQRDEATKAYQDALDAYNAQLNLCNQTKEYLARQRQDALDCDARRAQYDLGWRKEQACSLAQRSIYYQQWQDAENAYSRCLATLADKEKSVAAAKAALDLVIEAINKAIQQGKDDLQTNPTFVLSERRLQAEREKAAAAAELERRERNQKTALIVFGLLLFTVIVIIVVRNRS